MNKDLSIEIKNKIYTIRNTQVMIDKDLAELYNIKTKRINEQVRRNIERFPKRFMFQLNNQEKEELVAKCDHLKSLKFSSNNPYVFTEQGVAMLSTVLKSQIAITMSIKIIDAFIAMRKFLLKNAGIFQRISYIETKQIEYDKKFEIIFNEIEKNQIKPKQGIFFDGQIFDAHKLVSDIIRKSKKSITLIDNYIDDNVLTLFTKIKKDINITILTNNITKQLKLDINKYNKQYHPITIKKFNKSHDRFLIIDNNEIYHFGASLKDLGKKWFAFSRLDSSLIPVIRGRH